MFNKGAILSDCYLFGLLFFFLKKDIVSQAKTVTKVVYNIPPSWPSPQLPSSLWPHAVNEIVSSSHEEVHECDFLSNLSLLFLELFPSLAFLDDPLADFLHTFPWASFILQEVPLKTGNLIRTN